MEQGLHQDQSLEQINENINEEWISDKTRFYYDSLNIQRLLFPKHQSTLNVFETLEWIGFSGSSLDIVP